MEKPLIEECYKKSIELLKKNSTRYGFLASGYSKKAKNRNYLNIFGRDAAICSLAALASGDKKLIETAKKSLLTLAKYQAENGEIPFYARPEERKASFWYTNSVDSTLWWLITAKYYDKYSGEKIKLNKQLTEKINKALNWCLARENQSFYLIEQNQNSDWADLMPRSGYVLYSNVLWLKVKNLYNLKNKKESEKNFNLILDPSQKISKSANLENSRLARLISFVPRKKYFKNYLSFVNLGYCGEDIDVYGNILSILFGVAGKKREKNILKYFLKNKINKPLPIKSVLNPIRQNSKFWNEAMKIYNQNFPDQYHNGGIWPYIGGFWIMALAKAGNENFVQEELLKLAQANKINNWEFNEWFHGKTGKPMGMKGQTWNAGIFVLAYNCLNNGFKL